MERTLDFLEELAEGQRRPHVMTLAMSPHDVNGTATAGEQRKEASGHQRGTTPRRKQRMSGSPKSRAESAGSA
jgi:hypothetical protein